MRKLFVLFVVVLALLQPAWAWQVSEWSSSSGSVVRMVGTENQNFQIEITTNRGQTFTWNAWWVDLNYATKSFAYDVNGEIHYCNYTNNGYSIVSKTGNTWARWDFVRWLSR